MGGVCGGEGGGFLLLGSFWVGEPAPPEEIGVSFIRLGKEARWFPRVGVAAGGVCGGTGPLAMSSPAFWERSWRAACGRVDVEVVDLWGRIAG